MGGRRRALFRWRDVALSVASTRRRRAAAVHLRARVVPLVRLLRGPAAGPVVVTRNLHVVQSAGQAAGGDNVSDERAVLEGLRGREGGSEQLAGVGNWSSVRK